MPNFRQNVGYRRARVRIQRHNGNKDKHGMPTYGNDADWTDLRSWFCEAYGATGGETIRGRQVSAHASYVFYGLWSTVKDVTQADRLVYNGITCGILDVTDVAGDSREMVIDAKAE